MSYQAGQRQHNHPVSMMIPRWSSSPNNCGSSRPNVEHFVDINEHLGCSLLKNTVWASGPDASRRWCAYCGVPLSWHALPSNWIVV